MMALRIGSYRDGSSNNNFFGLDGADSDEGGDGSGSEQSHPESQLATKPETGS